MLEWCGWSMSGASLYCIGWWARCLCSVSSDSHLICISGWIVLQASWWLKISELYFQDEVRIRVVGTYRMIEDGKALNISKSTPFGYRSEECVCYNCCSLYEKLLNLIYKVKRLIKIFLGWCNDDDSCWCVSCPWLESIKSGAGDHDADLRPVSRIWSQSWWLLLPSPECHHQLISVEECWTGSTHHNYVDWFWILIPAPDHLQTISHSHTFFTAPGVWPWSSISESCKVLCIVIKCL